jgi:hypothetical protein
MYLEHKLKHTFCRSSTVHSSSCAPKSEPCVERVPRGIARAPEVPQQISPGMFRFLSPSFLMFCINTYSVKDLIV